MTLEEMRALREAKADVAFLLDRLMQGDTDSLSDGIIAVAYGHAIPGECELPDHTGNPRWATRRREVKLERCERIWALLPAHRKTGDAHKQLMLCRAALEAAGRMTYGGKAVRDE